VTPCTIHPTPARGHNTTEGCRSRAAWPGGGGSPDRLRCGRL